MATPWWIWIALFGLTVIWVLGCVIAGRIVRSRGLARSGLDSEEIAVVRRAAKVGGDEHISRALGTGVLAVLQVPPPLDLRAFRYSKHRTAAKKVVSFDPREQNRADGVIFWFYELRITRTELIKGYEKNAQRVPLQGLTATVTTGQTVYITIEGPDTKFVYRKGFDAEFNLRRAQQFAALLNYEASLLGASPKKVQDNGRLGQAAPATDVHEKSTKVECPQCQHVQTVPVSREKYSCEQCHTQLMRRTALANDG